jgi:hypothetical protein
LLAKESKEQADGLNGEARGTLINSNQARTLLMQKLMDGKDMGDLQKAINPHLPSKNPEK